MEEDEGNLVVLDSVGVLADDTNGPGVVGDDVISSGDDIELCSIKFSSAFRIFASLASELFQIDVSFAFDLLEILSNEITDCSCRSSCNKALLRFVTARGSSLDTKNFLTKKITGSALI